MIISNCQNNQKEVGNETYSISIESSPVGSASKGWTAERLGQLVESQPKGVFMKRFGKVTITLESEDRDKELVIDKIVRNENNFKVITTLDGKKREKTLNGLTKNKVQKIIDDWVSKN